MALFTNASGDLASLSASGSLDSTVRVAARQWRRTPRISEQLLNAPYYVLELTKRSMRGPISLTMTRSGYIHPAAK